MKFASIVKNLLVENAVSKFLDKVREEYYEIGDPLIYNVGGVHIEVGIEQLKDGEEALFINDMYTDQIKQGKGAASKVMNAIIDYANKYQMPISLRASAGGHYNQPGMNQDNLISWYKRLGFKIATSRSAYGEDEIFMVKDPG